MATPTPASMTSASLRRIDRSRHAPWGPAEVERVVVPQEASPEYGTRVLLGLVAVVIWLALGVVLASGGGETSVSETGSSPGVDGSGPASAGQSGEAVAQTLAASVGTDNVIITGSLNSNAEAGVIHESIVQSGRGFDDRVLLSTDAGDFAATRSSVLAAIIAVLPSDATGGVSVQDQLVIMRLEIPSGADVSALDRAVEAIAASGVVVDRVDREPGQ